MMTSRHITRKSATPVLIILCIAIGFVSGSLFRGNTATHAAGLKYATYDDFVKYVQAHHKAPFEHDVSVIAALHNQGREAAKIIHQFTITSSGSGTNIKVNQDRNPWPKAEIGAGIDPTNGKNYVVMANDFRENYDHEFYHVSTNGGQSWTDDSMTVGQDPFTSSAPFNFQSDPGVAFDRAGHSYISAVTGNLIFDGVTGYENLDTEIELAAGYNHGTYTSLQPTPIDDQPCNGTATAFTCSAQLDKEFVTVDNVPGSPHNGSIYVYYTLFCNGDANGGPCIDGSATVPALSSAILESHSAGAGLPFSAPALVSGSLKQEQFSDMVIDSHGTPHIFFDDFSSGLAINMYESTLSGSTWTISSAPVATFQYNGLNNLNWSFRDNGTVAPGCGIHKDTAYCAFSASQIGTGPVSGTPSVYLATVNTITAASRITRVNTDPLNDSKDHFFPWASAAPNGNVYVGWYDNRHDPFNVKVDYFVGKSTDSGKTFPTQKAVNDVSFNPCVGFPGCSFFGDYTQLVTGPDGVTHAAWSDTRDGASMQIYTQAITW